MAMTSRRVFLKDGGLALLSVGFAPRFLLRTAAAGRGRRKVLVAIFQRGAVDGLNTVIPFAERDYYFARPSIAVARPGSSPGAGDMAALDLDGFFGLHPRLGPLHRLYQRGQLAVVHACGSPSSTRSHFDAQDYLETGTPGVKRTADGWLNRYLSARSQPAQTPFRGVALTEMLPRSLLGPAPALAIPDLRRFGLRGGPIAAEVREMLEADYAAARDPGLMAAGRDAFEAARMLASAELGTGPANGAAYPTSAFGRALRQIARLIRADVGLEVACAESTRWDHHANEGAATGQLADSLDELARGISALVTDLGDRIEDVLIMTMSEFGRTVAENGSGGTDHGHGNAMFLVGGEVNGGQVYGRWPGLAREQRFEGRDLAVTTDFRDVFAEVLVRHLGFDLAGSGAVFPGHALTVANFLGILNES